jgi:beta-galactosidase
VLNFGGANTIAVRVDATKFEGWFYEGAGIYRHVWLEKTSPLAIAPDGIFVYSEFPGNVPKGSATLRLRTTLLNKQRTACNATVIWSITAPDGKTIEKSDAQQTLDVSTGSTAEFSSKTQIKTPMLWSPEDPKLYKLVTVVSSGGKVVDRQETAFGIRTVGFDPKIGFLLNGQRYEIHGTCNHQDHAGVGVAMPDALQEFRVKRLKEFGCNAYRTSHNPPTPELLDVCDRLGMLVMDESRLLGSDSENLRKLEELVCRDHNHPSVAIWSIANEELAVHDTPQAGRVAQAMQDLIKRLDPTRPVTYAANEKNVFVGINSVIEVRGWNYHLGAHVDDYHVEHPTQPMVGTEQASVVGTRGIYANDYDRGHVNALDIVWPGWDTTAESWWTFFAERPWLSGAFVWTGFDYRGEPSPCNWPSVSSHFGILDTCGFAKDSFYYYKSWWTTASVLHLAPHWNWAGQEGQQIRVQVFSNCTQVELFLNGVSQGKQPMKHNSKLFWQVKYVPGILSAKGYDDADKVIAETKVETTGRAEKIFLTPDRATINADGEDVAVFTVSAVDAQGRIVPLAQDKINFALDGVGKIIGVGNGDPNCHEPDTFIQPTSVPWTRSLFNGLAQVIVQSTRNAGEIKLTASANGLEPATVVVRTKSCPVRPFVP